MEFIAGIFIGIIITYSCIILRFSVFQIPIQYIKIHYYKTSTKSNKKLNDIKLEAEMQRRETEILSGKK